MDDAALRQRLTRRFDCLLADEYQDVNAGQYRWLRMMAEPHGEIFVVGDDDQAVFGWRGADIAYIRRFLRDFPHATQVKLEDNFRSTGHILDAANSVIARDEARLGKTLRGTRGAGQPIEVVSFRDAEAEAQGIVAEILQRHHEGVAWEAMAILYRANFLSRGFEEALLHAGVPYVLVGDVGFYQRAEIKDALALLRLAVHPDDRQSDDAFRRVCNSPRRGIGERALAEIEQHAEWRRCSLLAACQTAELPPRAHSAAAQFADMVRAAGAARDATVADRLSLLLDRSGYRSMLRDSRAEASADRLENLGELVALAGAFHTSSDLLDHAALATSSPGEARTGRVHLLSLHRAKGLEFEHVFLPAWDDGVFPSQYGDPAEERRLAYVAITRARARLAITHVAYRHRYSSPSVFLNDIPAQHRHKGWLRTPNRDDSRRAVATKTRASLQALDEMLASMPPIRRTRPIRPR
jgi:DNA helicase-2/ATP-dependent DNA helicase PcrA